MARHADACNLFASSPDDVAHKLDVLRRHCDAEGRDPGTIDGTILALGSPLDDVDSFIADMERYAAIGIVEVQLMPTGDPVEFIEKVGEAVVPALRSLGDA